MRIKKVLAAAGVVGVVTPAALAAAMISGGKDMEEMRSDLRDVLGNALALASLQELLADRGPPESRLPPRADPMGKGPVLADLIAPQMSDFEEMQVDFASFRGGEPAGGGVATDGGSPFAMMTGGPIGAAGQQSSASGAGAGAGGLFGPGGGATGAGSGAGGIGGGGASGAGDAAKDDALIELDPAAGSGDPNVVSAPLPPTVWMLLAGIGGLFYLGRRRATS